MNHESDNPDKGQLLQRSALHRELLEDDVKQIAEKSEQIITNALIIGGALAVSYLLVSSLSGSSKKKKQKATTLKLVEPRPNMEADDDSPDEPAQAGVISQIGSVLVAQATGFLLSIAREKLVEFLQSQATKKDNAHGNS